MLSTECGSVVIYFERETVNMVLSEREYQQVIAVLNHVFLKSPLPTILAFGSRVDGSARKHSDLDLIIKADTTLPLSQYYQLKDEFEYSVLPFRVDVLDWFRMSDEFKDTIADKVVNLQSAMEQKISV